MIVKCREHLQTNCPLTSAELHLQAHAPDLFACGIAKSGAYNRTLTPFGFQAEERTLWQATDVYMKMSPFLNVRTIFFTLPGLAAATQSRFLSHWGASAGSW